ncbi:hypothetical protein IAU60_004867 [Kwoniella sp. DSM 27419]
MTSMAKAGVTPESAGHSRLIELLDLIERECGLAYPPDEVDWLTITCHNLALAALE